MTSPNSNENNVSPVLQPETSNTNPVDLLNTLCSTIKWPYPSYESQQTNTPEFFKVSCRIKNLKSKSKSKSQEAAKMGAADMMYKWISNLAKEHYVLSNQLIINNNLDYDVAIRAQKEEYVSKLIESLKDATSVYGNHSVYLIPQNSDLGCSSFFTYLTKKQQVEKCVPHGCIIKKDLNLASQSDTPKGHRSTKNVAVLSKNMIDHVYNVRMETRVTTLLQDMCKKNKLPLPTYEFYSCIKHYPNKNSCVQLCCCTVLSLRVTARGNSRLMAKNKAAHSMITMVFNLLTKK